MRRIAKVCGLVVILSQGVIGAHARAATHGFTFAAPAGWLDISPGTPEENRERAPKVFRDQMASGQFAFLAIDLDHGADGFMENMNAVVQRTWFPMPISRTSLAVLALSIETQMAQRGARYRCIDKKVVKIGDVDVGRLVGEIHDQGITATLLQYTIPGHGALATLTFSTTPAAFAEYEARFDVAAQATRGAVTPLQARPELLLAQGVLGVLAVAITIVLVVRRRRAAAKKQATAG